MRTKMNPQEKLAHTCGFCFCMNLTPKQRENDARMLRAGKH